MTRIATIGLALLVAGLLPVNSQAACSPEDAGHLITLPFVGATPSSCEANDDLVAVVDALNEASDGSMAYVLVKDFGFHPQITHIKSGGSVTFIYADLEWAQNHDPRSSGVCREAGADPMADPVSCTPGAGAGRCFDVFHDQGAFMKSMGDTYPLTFEYDQAQAVVKKSHGMGTGSAMGDLTGAQPFRSCPSTSVVTYDEAAVIPYHCKIHGDAFSTVTKMRGTIIVGA